MGLFDFLSKKKAAYNGTSALNDSAMQNGVYVENNSEKKENIIKDASFHQASNQPNNIDLLFQFLDRNYEVKGYEDALVNSDAQYLEQNIAIMQNELERTIRKVKTYYEDFINEIDFHIASRSRSGLVDTVEELKMKRAIAESHIKKIAEIETDAINNHGGSQGIIISYTKGFRNGLTAISQQSILKRKL